MDERLLIALVTMSGAFLLAGLGFFYRGVAKFTEAITILKQIQAELGDHETGLRGSVHRHSKDLLLLDGRIKVLEERSRWENED